MDFSRGISKVEFAAPRKFRVGPIAERPRIVGRAAGAAVRVRRMHPPIRYPTPNLRLRENPRPCSKLLSPPRRYRIREKSVVGTGSDQNRRRIPVGTPMDPDHSLPPLLACPSVQVPHATRTAHSAARHSRAGVNLISRRASEASPHSWVRNMVSRCALGSWALSASFC
jgi:hypothetical protein